MSAATPSATLAAWARTRLLEHCRAAAGAALAAGVTTVRDLGDRRFVTLRLREELAAHPARGPQLLVSGPPVTTRGGHCWFFGGEAAGVEGVRSAVRTLAARGVDVVKVMVTGGNLTPGSVAWQSQYGPAELRAAVEEAHRVAQAARCAAVGPQVLTSAGFTGAEALRAVTSVAATACRVGDRKGRIAPGYDADLLAVDGDPLTDANALREVVAVFRAGTPGSLSLRIGPRHSASLSGW
jgi:imidazolonepropionase-like amidohydrolase